MKKIITGSEAHSGERGWALVSVLWVVTGLTLLAAAAEALSFSGYRLERRTLQQVQIEAILDAGLTRAVLGIEDPDVKNRWRLDGTRQTFAFGNAVLTLAVQDELGRFDLNAMDGSMLAALFRSQGASQDEAQTLSDHVLDWRSPGNGELHRLHGATDADYESAHLPYRSRHAAFENVEELQLVLGMPRDLFERVRPALTVYTHRPMIDPAVAPREALLALYRGDEDKVRDTLNARNLQSDAETRSGGSLSFVGMAVTISERTDIGGHAYARTAVILLTGDGARPYLVLAFE